jgi:hypothetical protein
VHVGEGQVPPHVPDGGVGEELADDRFGLPAVRAFEVPELDHGDRSAVWAADVVAVRVDRGYEVLDESRITEQGLGSSLALAGTP